MKGRGRENGKENFSRCLGRARGGPAAKTLPPPPPLYVYNVYMLLCYYASSVIIRNTGVGLSDHGAR